MDFETLAKARSMRVPILEKYSKACDMRNAETGSLLSCGLHPWSAIVLIPNSNHIRKQWSLLCYFIVRKKKD